jgi:hypothetical protein
MTDQAKERRWSGPNRDAHTTTLHQVHLMN